MGKGHLEFQAEHTLSEGRVYDIPAPVGSCRALGLPYLVGGSSAGLPRCSISCNNSAINFLTRSRDPTRILNSSRVAKIHELSHHLRLTTHILKYYIAKANHTLANSKLVFCLLYCNRDKSSCLKTRRRKSHYKVVFSWDKGSKKENFPRDSYEVTLWGLHTPSFSGVP